MEKALLLFASKPGDTARPINLKKDAPERRMPKQFLAIGGRDRTARRHQ